MSNEQRVEALPLMAHRSALIAALVVRILHVPARALVRDHFTRSGSHHGVVWHIFDDDAVGPNRYVVTDNYCAENLCARADEHVVTDYRIALARPPVRLPDGHAVGDVAVFADHRAPVDKDIAQVFQKKP